MRRSLVALALTACALASHAQLNPVDPDWKEVEAPPPGALVVDGAIPLEMPRSLLRFGVAPASVSIGADGIVRYVVVATSASGAVNGLYEGIRCNTGEFKVYARHNPGSGWVIAKDAQWKSLHETHVSAHSLAIARTGACIGHGTNQTASAILRDLRRPADRRFEQP
ncbi:CNP1-like family protein [Caenimonas aquaedulcis]|uniref:CNP1-like family protein n=1 Tax=Caenimonas aquaedulcis TaxID=2793270 RepID=A0A931H7A8_9BURK|nr:CNP1-like family protein [Caenimonas aquaedulcis]MBG9389991.1 CNP1-like family protein [Caenimonas aquaedulcis]